MKRILTALLLTWAGLASAQSIEFDKKNFPDSKEAFKEAQSAFKEGNNLYEQGPTHYEQALEPYLRAQKFNPNNALLNFRIGNAYLSSNFKHKAAPYLEKALQLDAQVDPMLHYALARGYHLNLQWDKAIKEYRTYRQSLSPKDALSRNADLDKKIQECQYGAEYMKKPVRVFLDNLGREVNSTFSEYGPVISADESVMLFTSRRDNTTGGGKDKNLNEYFEDVYISTNKEGKWTPAINAGKPINTSGHDATVGLAPDGQHLLIYLANNNGDIYECALKGNTWGAPEALSSRINSDGHESSASYSSNGKYIYFISDKEEGSQGERDIWMCSILQKGKVDKATNLGTAINTPYNEEGVFMHPDGKTMYFSSEGHSSMGGYDIFKSTFENGRWSTPENLGYPVNTPDDDVFLVISASGKHGYYASNQETGFGGKDIYMITFLGPEKPPVINTEDILLASLAAPVKETVVAPAVDLKSNKVTILKGVVTDANSKVPLQASVELVDNTKNEVIATFTSNSTTGRYLVSLPSGVNYGIAVKADGYLFHSENFDIPASAAYKEVVKDIALKKAEVGVKIVLNNIFFDFDKATLKPESMAELERVRRLLEEMPSLKIEMSGHTDNVGNAAYNQQLSENRAKAVVNHLISKGISKDRLTFAGYGLTQPVATNATKQGRQLNRRTEFKILSK